MSKCGDSPVTTQHLILVKIKSIWYANYVSLKISPGSRKGGILGKRGWGRRRGWDRKERNRDIQEAGSIGFYSAESQTRKSNVQQTMSVCLSSKIICHLGRYLLICEYIYNPRYCQMASFGGTYYSEVTVTPGILSVSRSLWIELIGWRQRHYPLLPILLLLFSFTFVSEAGFH